MLFNPNVYALIITKLFLILFLWYIINGTEAKKRLIFYKNLGISTLKLYSYVFLIDCAFSILIYQFLIDII